MRRLLWAVGLLVLTALLFRFAAEPEPQVEAVRFQFSSAGCFHSESHERVWRRGVDGFSSADTKVRLSVEQVQDLRRLALQSPRGTTDVARRVGITPEALASHRLEILQLLEIDELPAELEPLLEYSMVSKRVRCEFLESYCTTTYMVRVFLEGPSPMFLATRPTHISYLLPWTVRVGKDEWQTCDPALSLAVLDFCPDLESPKRMLDGRNYWESAVWSDESFWYYLEHDWEAYQGARMAESMGGYDRMLARFILEKADLREEFSASLAPRRPQTINACWWQTPPGKHDWADFIRVYDAAEAEAGRHPWLLNWRLSKADLEVRLDASGDQPCEMEPDKFDLTAWQAHQLRGSPRIEVALSERNRLCAKVWLAPGEPRALLYGFSDAPPLPPEWGVREGEYVVIGESP